MAETPVKNLHMLKGLCGGNVSKKVIIVTTMQDRVDEKTGVSPEEEMKKIYHTSVGRFEGTRDSAFRMIAPLLREPSSRIALSIQEELVDYSLILSETVAGQVLRLELKRSTEQHQEMLYQIQEKIKLGAKSDSLQSLKEEHEKLKKSSGSLLRQMHDLQVPLGRRVANTVARTLGKKRNY